MNSIRFLILALGVSLTSLAGAQTTFVETFGTGANTGGWSWGTGNESIVPLNGNPGAYLRDLTLASCCPAASTWFGLESVFSGDYRARRVTSVGIDLVTLATAFGMGDRPLSVILIDDNGTPFDFEDDSWVFFIGDRQVPRPGVDRGGAPGWTSFDFDIPSQETSLPEGWFAHSPTGEPDDVVWNRIITAVDTLQFFYGDPRSIFLFNSWQVGMDNPRITEGAVGCNAADLVEPFGVLDLGDVQAFLAAFVAGEAPADLAEPFGVFDLADVQAFAGAFVGGCP
jgi:hypothetical protein